MGPPRGVPRGVPEGSRGSQRDPEEELRSVFKGKVARNNYLKIDFFNFYRRGTVSEISAKNLPKMQGWVKINLIGKQ